MFKNSAFRPEIGHKICEIFLFFKKMFLNLDKG